MCFRDVRGDNLSAARLSDKGSYPQLSSYLHGRLLYISPYQVGYLLSVTHITSHLSVLCNTPTVVTRHGIQVTYVTSRCVTRSRGIELSHNESVFVKCADFSILDTSGKLVT